MSTSPPAGNGAPPKDLMPRIMFFVLLLISLTLCVLLLLPGGAGRHLRDLQGEVIKPVFVAVPLLLLGMSFFRFTIERGRPTVARAHVSVAVVVVIALCFAFGTLLSAHSNETVLVYILGFAALIIGGQHLVEFEEAQETIREVDRHLTSTTTALTDRLGTFEATVVEVNKQIDARVAELAKILGYTKYRTEVNKAYGAAKTRILGSTNHWPIDPKFWSAELADEDCLDRPEFWSKQEVFASLRDAIENTRAGEQELRITFAGRLDILATGGTPQLSEQDFLLFIGVLWRLALARQLRMKIRDPASSVAYRQKSEVRVMVADVPINAHIIDDQAFLLLHLPASNAEQSYGLEITRELGAAFVGASATASVADVYAEIIERYTRTHVRSAREYAASLLVFAAVANTNKKFEDLPLVEGVDPAVPATHSIEMLLDTLGRREWAHWYYEYNREIHLDTEISENTLLDGATRLACDLLKHSFGTDKIFDLPGRRVWRDKWNGDVVTVDRLIEDLL